MEKYKITIILIIIKVNKMKMTTKMKTYLKTIKEKVTKILHNEQNLLTKYSLLIYINFL